MGADQRGGAGPEQEGLHEALQGARRGRQGQEGGGARGLQEEVTLTRVVRLLDQAVTGRTRIMWWSRALFGWAIILTVI